MNRKWFKDLINLFASNQPNARTPACETINKVNNIENDIDEFIISRAMFPTFQHCRIPSTNLLKCHCRVLDRAGRATAKQHFNMKKNGFSQEASMQDKQIKAKICELNV